MKKEHMYVGMYTTCMCSFMMKNHVYLASTQFTMEVHDFFCSLLHRNLSHHENLQTCNIHPYICVCFVSDLFKTLKYDDVTCSAPTREEKTHPICDRDKGTLNKQERSRKMHSSPSSSG